MKFLLMGIGFFCMFMAVHASIGGDSGAFIVLFSMGCASVVAATALIQRNRFITTKRRNEALSVDLSGAYDDPVDVHPDADARIDPEIFYPLWQKCNRCGVYLTQHGTANHPWQELDMAAEERREAEETFIRALDWGVGAGRIVEYTEPDQVEFYVWGEEKPVQRWTPEQTREYRRQVERNRQKKRVTYENNAHYNTVLGCTCDGCTRRRNGL